MHFCMLFVVSNMNCSKQYYEFYGYIEFANYLQTLEKQVEQISKNLDYK